MTLIADAYLFLVKKRVSDKSNDMESIPAPGSGFFEYAWESQLVGRSTFYFNGVLMAMLLNCFLKLLAFLQGAPKDGYSDRL